MLKHGLMAGGVLAGVAAVVALLMVFENRRLERLTAEAPGQVTRVVVQTDAESDSSTIVHFAYLVGGQTLADQSSKAGDVSEDFLQGQSVVVCYDPEDPAETEVYQPGQTCPPR